MSAQLRSLREYAARNGYEVVREFVDEAESGKTAARPAFREMISAARRIQRPFDIILVWKYSRFARSREDSIIYKAMLKKKGIRVVSVSEPAEDTPTGKLLEAMIESLDEFYSANLGEEVTRGMRESASRGFYLSAVSPFGYRKVKIKDGGKEHTKLDIEPNQAGIVARMFSEVLHGKGLGEVVKQLNKDGISGPRGKGWGKTSIRKILSNEVYIGTAVWGRDSIRDLPVVRAENAWPAIITKEAFDRVKILLKERAPVLQHPRRVASRYLLSGLARCGLCGKALVGQDAKSGKFTYYVCGTLLKKGAGSCPSRYLNSQRFEAAVIDKLKEHVLTADNLTRLVRVVNEEMDGLALEYRERLDNAMDEIADVDRRLDRLYDALETGKIQLADLAPRIQQLRQRKEQLQATKWKLEQELSDRRVELADAETVAGYVNDLHNVLNESSLAEKKSFVRSFVKEVKVTGGDVLLTYTIPMLPKGMTEEKLPVLSTVHYGGR
ncbi:MAG: recombinase family protein [Dehalococcoidia bacterium]|nr:recombinase family protein [Dehalococcoidia bacterium]